jgi:hypothetical protein
MIHADAFASLTLARPCGFSASNLTAMSNPSRPRRRKLTPARRKHLIAEKQKFAEKWLTDRPGMIRRCEAGGEATADKAKVRREVVEGWLTTMPLRMTKAQLVKEFKARMTGDRDVQPRSLLEKMRIYGRIKYDETTGLWTNMTKA